MIRMAIVDDEKVMLDEVSRVAKTSMKKLSEPCSIDTYGSAKQLFFHMEGEKMYDVFLLDIEMPEISGVEIAEKLRAKYKDIYIIFITSHLQFAVDAYELDVFRYIPKTAIAEKLPKALEKLVEREHNTDRRFYSIGNDTRMEKIFCKDIIYIYKDLKNSMIVTENRESKARKTLKQVARELDSDDFIFIDRSYLVNIKNIMRLENGKVILSNGKELPISRPQLNNVKQKINSYWRDNI